MFSPGWLYHHYMVAIDLIALKKWTTCTARIYKMVICPIIRFYCHVVMVTIAGLFAKVAIPFINAPTRRAIEYSEFFRLSV